MREKLRFKGKVKQANVSFQKSGFDGRKIISRYLD